MFNQKLTLSFSWSIPSTSGTIKPSEQDESLLTFFLCALAGSLRIPVCRRSGPEFVRLSHKATPTVIGSSLKPLVTSAPFQI